MKNPKKSFLISLLIIVVVLIVIGILFFVFMYKIYKNTTITMNNVYTDKVAEYTITFPEHWQIINNPGFTAIASGPGTDGSMVIEIKKMDGENNAANRAILKKQLQTVTPTVEDTKFAGEEAILTKQLDPNGILESWSYTVLHGGRVYVVVCGSSIKDFASNKLNYFDPSIASFAFLNTTK